MPPKAEPVSLICAQCGVPFLRDAHVHRYMTSIGRKAFYCSKPCAIRGTSANLRAKYAKEFVELTCAHCGKEFSRARSWYNGKAKDGQVNFYCCIEHTPFRSKPILT